ncbi:[FeFe] hydrogenase H-cluster radical SAM maturase HydE [Miniphocaeibacter halophilus]|uniref:[FeFe] hydrogenase H-cluster radical SAM maturase HydE n=1 Tax=Miniphocaeibacter halophilus TaxID=2931922 RepID=A0AC61MNI6_9FIRM|nr:[FeFe] hydrogenase H-cluster radical SAM maturase HydE [Miniphocaeibacter halophilus]QQK07090.1 [FeFe] hydrogenase H-cluster radical SAM maturase HydE [Miniphocaeibacter halophilus]
MNDLVKKLFENKTLSNEEFLTILADNKYDEDLKKAANIRREEYYGKDVYIRGLIEFSNYCKNNCFYCGIRAGNNKASRYRLNTDDILNCCREGYKLGFRTFVLQGGEDPYFTDDIFIEIIAKIRSKFPDCAITLSLGERNYKSFKNFFDAGTNRYLLRHETANEYHFNKIHPNNLSLENRKKCIFQLKEIGYQVGSGFMVGSPFQKLEYLVEDLRFLETLQPDMIGIGPFLSHKDTPFKNFENGSMGLTIKLISILRLMFPYSLIPSTTALGTIHPEGRELGLKAGANVVMPNLSPSNVRNKYELYDNKIYSGSEAAESIELLTRLIKKSGFNISVNRGDVKRTTI